MTSTEDSGYPRQKDTEGFEPRRSIWDMILEQCPRGEVEEVKRLLGTSLVEQVIDLQEDVMTLLEIWRQVREDTDVTLSRPSRLPEPPHVRERLVKEIKFFVDSLQKRSGALPSTITSSRVVEYVNLSSTSSVPEQGRGESSVSRRSGGSRPDSAVSSWDGRDTPLRSGSSSGRQGRPISEQETREQQQNCSLSENFVGEINEQINSTNIDQIISKLREGLELDCEQCRLDLHFLQQCVDGEQFFVSSLEQQQHIPTLGELREAGSKLEKEFLSSSGHLSSYVTLDDGRKGCHLVPLPPATPKPQGTTLNRASKVQRGGGLDTFSGRGQLKQEKSEHMLTMESRDC